MSQRILLVEDDPFLVDIYKSKLNESGFEVVVARDGEEALRKFSENELHLVILDIVLPRMDGWEVLRMIKEQSDSKKIPVLIFSNLGQKAEIEKGFGLGATEYLIKAHYTPSEVVKKIKNILSDKA